MTMVQSGRPSHGQLTRRVWEIADKLMEEKGEIPRGREVVDAYLAEDPTRNEGTGFTQYSHWKRAQSGSKVGGSVRGHVADETVPGPDDLLRIEVAADGTLRLPAGVMSGLQVPKGGILSARLLQTCAKVEGENGQLVLVEPMVALRRLQGIAQKYKKPGESVVDSFLAERRAAWGEE